MTTLIDLTCEYEREPSALGIDVPRFGWAFGTDRTALAQSAYRIQVCGKGDFAEPLWDSGRREGDESSWAEYDGPPLQALASYAWRAKAWVVHDGGAEETPWSEAARFETARLGLPWTAPFIAPPDGWEDGRPAYLRREFVLAGTAESARLYVTALGLYEVYLNGVRVGQDLLRPGWTSYGKRLAYQTYDAGGLLAPGKNVLAAVVADGWYAGDLTWLNARKLYGPAPALSAELVVRGKGACRVTTDARWKAGRGPLRYAQLYHGETYDARLEAEGWDRPGFDDGAWETVRTVPFDASVVVPQDGPPVVRRELLPALKLHTTPKGERVLDFGQNLSGWVRFSVSGPAGSRVVLKHAEILDKDGNFYAENMRSARNTVEYTLKGGGTEFFEPRFSFQGFRYVQVVEHPGEAKPGDFAAQVIHSDMGETLEFECSAPLLNQLHHNILWGWKGNAVDVPTDCPQRDERLGWTGDAQVFIGTAAYLMGVGPFFRKWLRDLASDQRSDGGVPYVIPDILSPLAHLEKNLKDSHSSTGWGDAAVVCPWTIYERYGDRRLLAEQYPSMVAWVEHIRRRAQGGVLWNEGFHFADWVALDAKEGSYFGATPNDLVATAYYAYSAELLSRAAAVLGRQADAAAYGELHGRIADAFRREFFTPAGRLAARTQTGHILALVLGLVPQEHRGRCVADLCALIAENGGHLTTGFLGTPWLLRALSENGRLEDAYALLLKEDYPSWLFQVKMGATTVWEHWDGMKADGSLWSRDMNSFNHYAYGAVGEWMYRTIGGLETDGEAALRGRPWQTTRYAPRPGGGISSCRAAYRSAYGRHELAWEAADGVFSMTCAVPPNTRGVAVLPDGSRREVGSGTHRFSCALP